MHFRNSELKKVHVVIASNDPKTLRCEQCKYEWVPETKETTKGPVLFGTWYICPNCSGHGIPSPTMKPGTPTVKPETIAVRRPMGRPKEPILRPHHEEIVEAFRGKKRGYQRELAEKFGVTQSCISAYIKDNNLAGSSIVSD